MITTGSSVKFHDVMKKINFAKMTGAGNDFVVIDGKINTSFNVSEELVQRICDRRNGVGADGLIIINDSIDHNFVMNYYNADGSTGSLCANGARCAVIYASTTGRLNGLTAKFISNEIEYNAELLSNSEVRFYLNPPKN